MKKILVSACLLGYNCKYNGKNNLNEKVIKLKEEYEIIPVCPEVFGGLSTPRKKSERLNDKVISEINEDVTVFFNKGAEKTLEIAKKEEPSFCVFKENSPSCGVNNIYDGSFSNNKIIGKGVTTELLENNGFKIISELDLI